MNGQSHDAIRWGLTLVWGVVLVILLITDDSGGKSVGAWVLVGLGLGIALALWQRSHREPPAPPPPSVRF